MMNRRQFMAWLGLVPAAPVAFSFLGKMGIVAPPTAAAAGPVAIATVAELQQELTALEKWHNYVNAFNNVIGHDRPPRYYRSGYTLG